MGNVDHQLDGYLLFWYSNDHEPPHFNIEKIGHWGIKVKFMLTDDNHLEFEIVWQNQTRGPSGKEQKLFREYIREHRAHLLEEWEKKVCKQK